MPTVRKGLLITAHRAADMDGSAVTFPHVGERAGMGYLLRQSE